LWLLGFRRKGELNSVKIIKITWFYMYIVYLNVFSRNYAISTLNLQTSKPKAATGPNYEKLDEALDIARVKLFFFFLVIVIDAYFFISNFTLTIEMMVLYKL